MGEYADAPVAQWLRGQLERREWAKQDLADALMARRGIKKASANKTVIGWTLHGQDPNPAGRADLRAIFGEDPPDGGVAVLAEQVSELRSEVADLRERVRRVEAQRAPAAPRQARAQRAS